MAICFVMAGHSMGSILGLVPEWTQPSVDILLSGSNSSIVAIYIYVTSRGKNVLTCDDDIFEGTSTINDLVQ